MGLLASDPENPASSRGGASTETGQLGRCAAVGAGAVMLLWPAMVNRYPLLNPDSVGYLAYGRVIWRALAAPRGHGPFAARSEMYCLGIYPLHWNVSPWPIAAVQALMTAYVLWLVVGSRVRRRRVEWFLGMVGILGLVTSVGWQASWVMPDVLGVDAYLCIFLLVFGAETLSLWELWAVGVLGWWGLTAHATHLMVAVVLCAVLGVVWGVKWAPLHARGRMLGRAAGVVGLAAGSQMALHAYLDGTATLGGYRPPYLMARSIADGPGRSYLQRHCGELEWVVCRRWTELPESSDDLLWSMSGLWQGASEVDREELLREESPLVLGAVREFPRTQVRASARNFVRQAVGFGFRDFGPSEWTERKVESVIPGGRAKYRRSLQARNAMPERFSTLAQKGAVVVSVLGLCVGLPLAWRRRRFSVVGLAVVVVTVLVANALVCGVLSEVDDRYQNRVIWLMPLLALVVGMELFTSWWSRPVVIRGGCAIVRLDR